MKNVLIIAAFLMATTLFAQTRTQVEGQRDELGKVSWFRDYDEALAESTKTNKPVLILFQEVPGCATCQRYGTSTLSHPLMVEAIENEFVPLAVFNNKGGADRKVLEAYGEPSWNNPVVRIVDAKGKNLVERLAGNYSPKGLFTAMKTVLEDCGEPLPGYMKALEMELTATDAPVKEAYYQMNCFWSGEHHLGNKAGVLTTEPGFLGGHEVVKVVYDPATVTDLQLTQYAAQEDIKPAEGTSGYRVAKKDHYKQMQKTDFVYLPLTDVQKTKINAGLHRGQDVTGYLSPKQLALYQSIQEGASGGAKLYTLPFAEGWDKMTMAARK